MVFYHSKRNSYQVRWWWHTPLISAPGRQVYLASIVYKASSRTAKVIQRNPVLYPPPPKPPLLMTARKGEDYLPTDEWINRIK